MLYLAVSIQVALQFLEMDNDVKFDWDQIPPLITDFCDALMPVLVELSLVSPDSVWEPIFVRAGGVFIPTKRISLVTHINKRPSVVVDCVLRELKNPSDNHELFTDAEQTPSAETIQRAAEHLRRELGGKRIDPKLIIQIERERLELSGAIPKSKQSAPAIDTSKRIIYGIIDEPSVRDNNITVRTSGNTKSEKYFIDINDNLYFLHEAQKSQAICKITVTQRLNAQNKVINLIIAIAFAPAEVNRPEFGGGSSS